MDNENKEVFTPPAPSASLERLRAAREKSGQQSDRESGRKMPGSTATAVPPEVKAEGRAADIADGHPPVRTAAEQAKRAPSSAGAELSGSRAPRGRNTERLDSRRAARPGSVKTGSRGEAGSVQSSARRHVRPSTVQSSTGRPASANTAQSSTGRPASTNTARSSTGRAVNTKAAPTDGGRAYGAGTAPSGAYVTEGTGVCPVNVAALRRRKGGFFRALKIYIAVFAAVTAIGLAVFYAFMAAFEYTRADNRIRDYFSSLTGDAVYALISDRRGADGESSAAVAADLTSDPASLACARTGGTGDNGELIYGVTRDGNSVALVTIVPSGETRFGLDVYEVTSCTLSDGYIEAFLPTYYDVCIHAPSSGTVILCGEELDRAEAERGEVYPSVAGLSAYSGGDDCELVYTVEGLTEEPSAVYRDATGAEFPGEFDGDGVCRFDGVGNKTLLESYSETVKNFITTYVAYTAAGYTDGNMSRFEATRALTRKGSEAYDDITSSRFSFAQNIPCTVKSLDITSYDYVSHGRDMFSCSVDFTAEMKNFGQATDTVKGASLVFARQGDDFLVVRMRLS